MAKKKIGRPKKLSDVPDEMILEALADAGGIWADAARILQGRGVDVGRMTLRRYVGERQDLLERANEVRETAKDFAESVLWAGVRNGNGCDVRYFLSTQARDRGYGQKVEAEVTATQKVEPAIDYNTLTQDELRTLITLHQRAQGRKSFWDDELVMRGVLPPRSDIEVPASGP